MEQEQDGLSNGITALHEEAGGAFNFGLVMPDDVPVLLAGAAGGDPYLVQLLDAYNSTRRGARTACRRAPRLCACCPRPLPRSKPFAVAVVSPMVDNPAQGLAFGICPRCFEGTHAQVLEKAKTFLGSIWPGMRQISGVMHETPGNA